MVTPLDERGRIDTAGVHGIIGRLLAASCAPFVAGTTGESASLTEENKTELVEAAVTAAAGEALVYAGIADNSLEGCLRKAQLYGEAGADVAVCHLPSYYPIDEAQMLDWFSLLADKCPLPLMLYNIPVTTGISIPLSLIDELSHHANIVGLKDSERGDDRLRAGLESWRDRQDFTLHLGWAARSSFGLRNGLDGIVPSTANLVPGLYRGIYDAAQKGDVDEAERLQEITNQISAQYQEGRSLSRSIPVFKAMLAAFGLCKPCAAPPMLTLSPREQKAVADEALERWGRYVERDGARNA